MSILYDGNRDHYVANLAELDNTQNPLWQNPDGGSTHGSLVTYNTVYICEPTLDTFRPILRVELSSVTCDVSFTLVRDFCYIFDLHFSHGLLLTGWSGLNQNNRKEFLDAYLLKFLLYADCLHLHSFVFFKTYIRFYCLFCIFIVVVVQRVLVMLNLFLPLRHIMFNCFLFFVKCYTKSTYSAYRLVIF